MNSLAKNVRVYGLECDAHVYLAVEVEKNGLIFTFNSDSAGGCPYRKPGMVHYLLRVGRVPVTARRRLLGPAGAC